MPHLAPEIIVGLVAIVLNLPSILLSLSMLGVPLPFGASKRAKQFVIGQCIMGSSLKPFLLNRIESVENTNIEPRSMGFRG